MVGIACQQGLFADAEAHLAELEAWRDPSGPRECDWYDFAGELQVAAGRFGQAEELLAKGPDAAERHDRPFYKSYFSRMLQECERMKGSSLTRRRQGGARKANPAATKTRRRPNAEGPHRSRT